MFMRACYGFFFILGLLGGGAWASLPKDHSLELLKTGQASFEERYRLLKRAQRSIYLSAWALHSDAEGLRLQELLCQKAAAGLDVRIMADHYGSNQGTALPGNSMLGVYRRCGVRVLMFAPFQWGSEAWLYSQHEKMLLVDGFEAIFGGMSFGDKYRTASRDNSLWHDLDLKVEGPTVCHMQRRFETFWWRGVQRQFGDQVAAPGTYRPKGELAERAYGGKFVECVARPSRQASRAHAEGVLANPFYEREEVGLPLFKRYERAFRSAKHHVRLYAPFFIPHADYLKLLKDTARRGVRVEILVNSPLSTDDNIYTVIGMLDAATELTQAGVKIYFWGTTATLHRKVGIVDGKWGYVGSDNLDSRGQEYNSESVIFTDDRQVLAELEQEFALDRAYSYSATPAILKAELDRTSALDQVITRWLLAGKL